ncbi:MAG: flagellar hook assembly protein FlgD [Hydrogenophilaceae bacterium]|jgi:flagellar basal-body rod modification protein FlgD|nr:flagellar hook assembly protein FlgD [Hydrogenophilaceae bacterium]
MEVTAADTTSASQTARTKLSENFDTFLVLLTAQLQNQDPLSPMDSSEFTQQLVQFSQVEQQISTNDNLETLISQQSAAAAALPLSYLGRAALIESSRATLYEEGSARWSYSFEEEPASVTLTVKDSSGRIVYSEEGVAASGAHNFTWDGTKANGEAATPGVYTLSVVALDDAGETVASKVNVMELVTGVDFTSGAPRIVTSSGSHDLEDVLGVLDAS